MLSIDIMDDSTTSDFKESVLAAQAEAALGGHELGPFQTADTITGGYEATCTLCQMTTWIGDDGLRYSILADECPGQEEYNQEPMG